MVPWGFSILLALVFIVDLIEFSKNIHAKRTFDKHKHEERMEKDKTAETYIETAHHEILTAQSEKKKSYQKMLSKMPKEAVKNTQTTEKYQQITYTPPLRFNPRHFRRADINLLDEKDRPTLQSSTDSNLTK